MTNLDLLKDVDFDNSYEHVIDFDTKEKQETFFDSKIETSFDNFFNNS